MLVRYSWRKVKKLRNVIVKTNNPSINELFVLSQIGY